MRELGPVSGAAIWVLSGAIALGLHGGLGWALLDRSWQGAAAEISQGIAAPTVTIAVDLSAPPPPPAPAPPPRPVETKDLSDPLRADLPDVGYPVTDAAPVGPTLAPAPEEPPSPSATVEALVAVVRAAAGTACLAARPESPAPGSLGLALFALPETDPAALVAEAQTLVGGIALRRHDVAAPQCPALDFLRRAAAYPGNGLTLVLEKEALTGGDALAGVIAGAQPGAVVHLLLIDDAGLVQKLDAFLTALPEGGVGFRIPLSLQGNPVPGAQLLIALSAPAPLPMLRDFASGPATPVFDRLSAEFAAAGATADLAPAAFSLR